MEDGGADRTVVFVFNRAGIFPQHTPDKGIRPNPFMLAWVTNVLTSLISTLNLVQVVLEQTPRLVENFVYEATNSEQPD